LVERWQPDYWLREKIEIVERIAAKTETISRFIGKRKMKGLGRVLREREALLSELAAVNRELADDRRWQTMDELAPLRAALAAKQREVLDRSAEIVRQARTELARIALELKRSRTMRQAKNNYVNRWQIMTAGRRLNVKG